MRRRSLAVVYCVLCVIEGIWALASIWRLPGDGISQLRIVILAVVALGVGGFVALAVWEWSASDEARSLLSRLMVSPARVAGVFWLWLLLLLAVYPAGFSPMRIGLINSLFRRALPLLIWAALAILQFYILVLLLHEARYFQQGWQSIVRHRRTQAALRALRSPAAGYALLLVSFVIGLTKLYYGRFVDEADNLTVGWLLTQGYTLYQDVFSHHFPFPYFWVAGVVRLAGNSFAAVRISLLLLHLGLFAVSMKTTRLYQVIGLTSLAWNLINHFHRGQEAIYATFECLLMAAAFFTIFNLLVRRSRPGKFTLLWIGTTLGMALLTDPLMVYPAGIALLGVFISGLRQRAPAAVPLREGLRRALWSGGAIAVLLGVFAVYLLASGTAGDFYQQAIWFNQEIYAKYEDARTLRFDTLLRNAATGLDVFNPRWVRHIDPFISLPTYRSVKLEDENLYATWIFSGLLSRLSILACMAGLAMRRRISALAFLYLFAAAMMVRASDGLYAMGFTLVSLFAAFYLQVELRRLAFFRAIHTRQGGLSTGWQVVQWVWLLVLVFIGGMQVWSAFRGGYYIVKNWNWFASQRHVRMYDEFGDEIRDLACGSPDLELSVFPINPIVHFVTGIPPASRYVYMYPWVAEIGKEELITELKANPAAVVWINTGRKSGEPDSPAVYMAEVIDFLNEEYFVLGQDFWLSPELAERCGVEPGKTPFTDEISE